MPSKKHRLEEIIGKLREAEVLLAQGATTAEACRRIAVSEQTYYRWRKEYGGLKTDQARRMGPSRPLGLRSGEGECAASTRDLEPDARQSDPAGSCPGKLLSPARRRRCIDHIRTMMPISERRLCRVLGQHDTAQGALRGGWPRRAPDAPAPYPGTGGAPVPAVHHRQPSLFADRAESAGSELRGNRAEPDLARRHHLYRDRRRVVVSGRGA